MQSSGRWSNWQDVFAQGVKGNYFEGRPATEYKQLIVFGKS